MRMVEQSELGEAAIRLIREAKDESIVVRNGEQAIGAIVSMENFARVRRMQWEELDRLSIEASSRFAAHADELGISPEELLDQELNDLESS